MFSIFSPKKGEVLTTPPREKNPSWELLTGRDASSGDKTNRRFGMWRGMGEERGVHRVLVGKPEGKRPLGRPRRRWEDNIKIDLQEVGGGRGVWMELAEDREETGGGRL
jgi:hypothetical protein